jgi:Sulfotransferase family
MALAIPAYKLAYTPIPKVACTSIKRAWYALANGHPFTRRSLRGRLAGGSIHRVYRSTGFDAAEMARLADHWKVAVVRDPAARILSAYSSKVSRRDFLTKHARDRRSPFGPLRARMRGDGPLPADLPLRPGLDEFVLRLDDYRAAFGVIRNHTQPSGYYLGADLSAFDAIYRIDQIDDMAAEVSARSGQTFRVPKENTSPDVLKATVDDLSPEAFATLMERLAPDYELLAEFFPRPTRPAELNHTGT